ncbi:hypothetical protein [Acidimangrovimonas sediminis]|uniref:hypothetical protein n=1 Tax=Acidimangrovimonas sediminis TaxID=2056283 RepID=UPI000C806C69|nr:hypothetical protein [Acidimangrovimonas sediminis]
MTDPARFDPAEMLSLASRGVGKVDALGPRGATLVTIEEIEAMAATLACLGLAATPPGEDPPEALFIPA